MKRIRTHEYEMSPFENKVRSGKGAIRRRRRANMGIDPVKSRRERLILDAVEFCLKDDEAYNYR